MCKCECKLQSECQRNAKVKVDVHTYQQRWFNVIYLGIKIGIGIGCCSGLGAWWVGGSISAQFADQAWGPLTGIVAKVRHVLSIRTPCDFTFVRPNANLHFFVGIRSGGVRAACANRFGVGCPCVHPTVVWQFCRPHKVDLQRKEAWMGSDSTSNQDEQEKPIFCFVLFFLSCLLSCFDCSHRQSLSGRLQWQQSWEWRLACDWWCSNLLGAVIEPATTPTAKVSSRRHIDLPIPDQQQRIASASSQKYKCTKSLFGLSSSQSECNSQVSIRFSILVRMFDFTEIYSICDPSGVSSDPITIQSNGTWLDDSSRSTGRPDLPAVSGCGNDVECLAQVTCPTWIALALAVVLPVTNNQPKTETKQKQKQR